MPGSLSGASSGWTFAAASVFGAIFWLLSVYGDTAQAIVSIWNSSETFAHGYLIAPISAWMIWRRRHELAALTPQPNLLVLPLLALVGFGWLLAALAEVGVVQQYCLVFMIPLLVWTILGNRSGMGDCVSAVLFAVRSAVRRVSPASADGANRRLHRLCPASYGHSRLP
jgi:hypothetical protein